MNEEKADVDTVRYNLALQFICAMHSQTYVMGGRNATIDKDLYQRCYHAFRTKLEQVSVAYGVGEKPLMPNCDNIPEEFQMPEEFRRYL